MANDETPSNDARLPTCITTNHCKVGIGRLGQANFENLWLPQLASEILRSGDIVKNRLEIAGFPRNRDIEGSADERFAMQAPLIGTIRLCTPRMSLIRCGRPTMCFRRWLAAGRRGSSAKYLDRQKRDKYVRLRKEDGQNFVSRSAYKLLQLDAKYRLLSADRVVVDLGAAPGGWSQAVHTTSATSRLFAVDLLPLKVTIPGVEYLRGDFTEESTRDKLREMITGSMDLGDDTHCVDVVLSDMMGMSYV